MVHILALYSRPYFIYFKGPCGSWRRPQRRSGNMASNLLRYSLGPWSFSVRNCQLIKEPTVHDITSVPFTSLYFWNRYVVSWPVFVGNRQVHFLNQKIITFGFPFYKRINKWIIGLFLDKGSAISIFLLQSTHWSNLRSQTYYHIANYWWDMYIWVLHTFTWTMP